jgi:hypothetical protein
MTQESGNPLQTDEELRARARTHVYERLALASAVIWAVGTLLMFIFFVPMVARPQPYILVASIVPLLPAAIPWLMYERVADAVARRWATERDSKAREEGP